MCSTSMNSPPIFGSGRTRKRRTGRACGVDIRSSNTKGVCLLRYCSTGDIGTAKNSVYSQILSWKHTLVHFTRPDSLSYFALSVLIPANFSSYLLVPFPKRCLSSFAPSVVLYEDPRRFGVEFHLNLSMNFYTRTFSTIRMTG